MPIYRQSLNWRRGAESLGACSSINPRIERKAQFVLIAPVLKDSPVGSNWGEVEALLNILPINHLVSSACYHNCAFYLAVSQNRRDIELHCVSLERHELRIVAFCQIVLDDLLDFFKSRWNSAAVHYSSFRCSTDST